MIQLLKLEISKPNFQLFSIARTEECQQDGRIGSPLLVSLLRNTVTQQLFTGKNASLGALEPGLDIVKYHCGSRIRRVILRKQAYAQSGG